MAERFMYMTDLRGHPVFADPETYKVVVPRYTEIVGTSGLRRQILERDGDRLVETFEQAPLTPELAGRLRVHNANHNSWNYDWPHLQTELRGEGEMRERMRARLERELQGVPLDIKIVGLQRRYLLYYSDGSYTTQGRYLRVVPQPGTYPFDANGELLSVYTNGPTIDQIKSKKVTNAVGRPLLYAGPAWAVRFEVEGQQPAFGMTRVYVRDDGSFICSDWCQRDPTRADTTIHQQYGKGIDLLSGKSYTIGSWIMGPCLTRATAQGVYKPKGKVEVVAIGKLPPMVKVPTLEEALLKHKSAVSRMMDEGRSEDEIVAAAKQLLADRNREALHLVPVVLRSDGRYEPGVRANYADTQIDSHKFNKQFPKYFILRNYKKPGEPYATVDAVHLEVDESRLRKQVAQRKQAVNAIKEHGPIEAQHVKEALARLQELNIPELNGIDWDPDPSRFNPEQAVQVDEVVAQATGDTT